MSTDWGRTFGLPAVAEKGKLNLNITVSTLGGHSSVPPAHTNIGLSALLIAKLESNPFPITLQRESPVWGYLLCASEYAPDMPGGLKKAVAKAQKSSKALKALPDAVLKYGLGSTWTGSGQGAIERAMLGTTQAVDIINGGVKVNALVSSGAVVPCLTSSLRLSRRLSTTGLTFRHLWTRRQSTFSRRSSLWPRSLVSRWKATARSTLLLEARLLGTSRYPMRSRTGSIRRLSHRRALTMARGASWRARAVVSGRLAPKLARTARWSTCRQAKISLWLRT